MRMKASIIPKIEVHKKRRGWLTVFKNGELNYLSLKNGEEWIEQYYGIK